MDAYPKAALERAMKVQEVMLRAIDGRMMWWEAAEILGVSYRTMRRWKWRYEHDGYDGLLDRRRQIPGPRRVPLQTVKQVLRLYREEYMDFNVRHFHEKLKEEHGIELSYQWVKTALQTAGLVAKARKRGPHRKQRERRPMVGMMLMVDGSMHAWLPLLAGQKQDLILVMDDATSEVYTAYLVEEEGTLSVMKGLKEVIEKQGVFCSLYTDRGSHFFYTPKEGGPVNRRQLTQIGRALQQVGIEHIPSYSPQGRGRMERIFKTWQGRLPQELRRAGIRSMAEANAYIRQTFIPNFNRHMTVKAREEGTCFVPCNVGDLETIFSVQHERVVQNDNTVAAGSRRLQIEPSKWRFSFAKCRVKVCEHLDGTVSIRYGPHVIGRYPGPLNIPETLESVA
jgi:transposase